MDHASANAVNSRTACSDQRLPPRMATGFLAACRRCASSAICAVPGWVWQSTAAFGLSYADTLAAWAKTFLAEWIHIKDMGFDERFKQLWRFYLAYCEAGFRTGRIDVGHFSMIKP
eukprot:gene15276-20581_t